MVHPVHATDVFAAVKFGLDIAAKAAAHGAFTAISNRILNKVKTGGIRGALFVQDWRDFQLRAQYRGEEVWRGILYFAANGRGNIPPLLCDYIRNSTAFKSLQPRPLGTDNAGVQAIQRRYGSLQDVITTVQCDPEVERRVATYRQNFVLGGGWDTFARLLSAQNRTEGVANILINELGKQRRIEESAAVNESGGGGKGFTGIRECLVRGQGASGCAILGRIKTPGSTLGAQVASVFDANMKFYTTADAASLAVAALTEFLVGKLIDQGISPDPNTPTSIDPVPGTDPREVENSYKAEFCSARDNMSTIPTAMFIYNNPNPASKSFYREAYNMFPPEEDINSLNARDDNDVGKSYCKWRYDKGDNRDPFTRCMRACYQKLKLSEGNNLLTPEHIGPDGRWIDAGGLGNPEPPVPPPPPPPPQEPPSLLADVQAERGNYGTPMTPQELSNLLNTVAWINQGAGWGLLSKPSGNNCPFASGPIACDILFHRPSRLVYDVLIDSNNQAIPSWNLVGPENDLSRWFAPVQP